MMWPSRCTVSVEHAAAILSHQDGSTENHPRMLRGCRCSAAIARSLEGDRTAVELRSPIRVNLRHPRIETVRRERDCRHVAIEWRHAGETRSQGISSHRRRQRRVRGHGRLEPDAQGHQRADARCRHEVRAEHVLDARAAVGSARAACARRTAAAVLPRHQGTAVPDARRQAVRADSRLGPRRQDQRLGPRQPALLRSRLQGPGDRRLGDPVADRIQGRRAVLRQGRTAHRRLRRR